MEKYNQDKRSQFDVILHIAGKVFCADVICIAYRLSKTVDARNSGKTQGMGPAVGLKQIGAIAA